VSRLAVAVRPPPEVVEALEALDRPAVADVRWSTPEQWIVKVRAVVFDATDASWMARSLALVADRSAPGVPRLEDVAQFPLGS
jgi:hypothetical protein